MKGNASFSFGGKTYKGKVNRHQIMIKREPGEIYSILIDPNQYKKWAPFGQISMEKVTSGEFRVGTRLHFKLNFRIQPEWDIEVIHLEKPKRIVNRFINGIFKGGIEIWDLTESDLGTEVTHTLAYKIDRWIYKVGWYLLGGEKKHNELTELGLSRLKSILEAS